MAISTINPVAEDHGGFVTDLVSLKEAVLLFSQTGHGVSVTTLGRWIAADGIPVARGKEFLVSFSDLLEAHGRRNPRAGSQGAQAVP